MSEQALYAILGAIWMLCLLLVARAAAPLARQLWGKLNHRRDILDPPAGIYLINEDGSRQQLFAEFAGRRGWSTRVWLVPVPDELSGPAMRGELQMHVSKVPANSAIIWRGRAG